MLDAATLTASRGNSLTRRTARWLVSAGIVVSAFVAAAWLGQTFPFEQRPADPYSNASVVRAMPFDTPMPYDISLASAGRGTDLAYHTQWTSTLPPAEIAAQFNQHLAGSPRWVLTQNVPTAGEFTTTLVRRGSDGYMTHFARITVAANGGQTIVTLDFTPIPTDLAPE